MKKYARILGGIGAGIVALTMVLAPGAQVSAAEFLVPDESGNITISADSVHRNLYTAGGTVLLNNATLGDAVVVGGDVTIEGNVESDLTVAGGNVYINGTIGGDVRVAGGDVTINNAVSGDVVGVGGSIRLTDRAAVAGDVMIAGGQVEVLGPVTGKLTAHADLITINSAVTGAVVITAGQKLSLGAKTNFAGEAKYKSWQEAEIADGAQTGNLQYEQIPRKQNEGGKALAGVLTLGFVFKLLAMILASLVLLKLFPKTSTELVTHLKENVWANLGIGFVAFIAMPIMALLLLFTFVGFYAALIVFVLWLLWCMVGALVGMVFVGAWINQKFIKKEQLTIDWQAVVLGVVIVSILALIPAIGWLISLLIVWVGFGTIIRHITAISRSQGATPTINNETV